MKTSDITEWEVIDTLRWKDQHNVPLSLVELFDGKYPAKVIFSKISKMVNAGFLSYGVSLEYPWVESEHKWKRLPTGEHDNGQLQ